MLGLENTTIGQESSNNNDGLCPRPTATMAADSEYPKDLTNIPYSEDSSLNTLDIYLPAPPPPNSDPSALWLIYIHGGAWRDPSITSSSFDAIRSNLQTSPVASSITGYASLNYRLSPYPSHPTHPSDPSDPSRNAKHPDHITDILSALLYLQTHYPSSSNYILAGHSVGATLAFQVAMKRYWGSQYESTFALELNVVPPVAIVGIEGIYDIPALLSSHEDSPAYRDFVLNAMASKDIDSASPAVAGDFDASWEEGRLVVLAHSPDDELVEGLQTELMCKALVGQGWDDGGKRGRAVRMVELKGAHDEVWQTGEASRAIEVAVRDLPPE